MNIVKSDKQLRANMKFTDEKKIKFEVGSILYSVTMIHGGEQCYDIHSMTPADGFTTIDFDDLPVGYPELDELVNDAMTEYARDQIDQLGDIAHEEARDRRHEHEH